MPSVSLRNESSVGGWGVRFCGVLLLLLACRKETPPDQKTSQQSQARASGEPTRVKRPDPTAAFSCEQLPPPPATEESLLSEAIELHPPAAGKKMVLSKTGVVVTFDRDEVLQAARCLKLEKATQYVEQETGQAAESPLVDAFQLSYVAAALLDAGRASVRLHDETAPRKSIVRGGWAADGCGGRCRSFGRLYRLSDDDPSFFLRITDKTTNDWK